jgi:hypothetical protein
VVAIEEAFVDAAPTVAVCEGECVRTVPLDGDNAYRVTRDHAANLCARR